MKTITKSFQPSLINILFISLIFVFMNCSIIQDILGIDGVDNNGNIDETVQTLSHEEIMALCSTKDPELSFNLMQEEKQIYTLNDSSRVKVTFCNSFASFKTDLILDSPDELFIANNILDPIGTSKDLGLFNSRTELIFAIEVQDTGYTYFTGLASRNPDGLTHAKVFEIENNLLFIGFEDTFDGGDEDYNDINLIINIMPVK